MVERINEHLNDLRLMKVKMHSIHIVNVSSLKANPLRAYIVYSMFSVRLIDTQMADIDLM